MTLATDIADVLTRNSYVTTRSDVFDTGRILVPGIGTAAAYASGDTFGQLFEIRDVAREPGGSFAIQNVTFYDRDNEGLPKVLHLFRAIPMIVPADNAAWTMNVRDFLNVMPGSPIALNIATTYGSVCQTLTNTVAFLGRCDPRYTSIWGILTTNGADNIAANAEPFISFVGLRD